MLRAWQRPFRHACHTITLITNNNGMIFHRTPPSPIRSSSFSSSFVVGVTRSFASSSSDRPTADAIDQAKTDEFEQFNRGKRRLKRHERVGPAERKRMVQANLMREAVAEAQQSYGSTGRPIDEQAVGKNLRLSLLDAQKNMLSSAIARGHIGPGRRGRHAHRFTGVNKGTALLSRTSGNLDVVTGMHELENQFRALQSAIGCPVDEFLRAHEDNSRATASLQGGEALPGSSNEQQPLATTPALSDLDLARLAVGSLNARALVHKERTRAKNKVRNLQSRDEEEQQQQEEETGDLISSTSSSSLESTPTITTTSPEAKEKRITPKLKIKLNESSVLHQYGKLMTGVNFHIQLANAQLVGVAGKNIRAFKELERRVAVMEAMFYEFEQNSTPRLSHYTTMIGAYHMIEKPEKALALYEKMLAESKWTKLDSKLSRDVTIHNRAIRSYRMLERYEDAREHFSRMKKSDHGVDQQTYCEMMLVARDMGSVDYLRSLWQGLGRKRFPGNLPHANNRQAHKGRDVATLTTAAHRVMISCCVKLHNMELAREVFAEMNTLLYFPTDTSNQFAQALRTTFNILVGGFARQNEVTEVYQCLADMKSRGLTFDNITFQSIIKGYTDGKHFHSLLELYQRTASGEFAHPNRALAPPVVHAYLKAFGTGSRSFTSNTEIGLSILRDAIKRDLSQLTPQSAKKKITAVVELEQALQSKHDTLRLPLIQWRFPLASMPIVLHYILAAFKKVYQEEKGQSQISRWKRGVVFMVGRGPVDGVDKRTGESIIGLPSQCKRALEEACFACTPRLWLKINPNNPGIVRITKTQLKNWARANEHEEHQRPSIRPPEHEIRPPPTNRERRDNRFSIANAITDVPEDAEDWYQEVQQFRNRRKENEEQR